MSTTPIPTWLKQQVTEAHGTCCLKCGIQTTGEYWAPQGMHFDHVTPEAMGGLTTLANLQILCRDCNLAKGARYADYRTVKIGAETQRTTGKPVWMYLVAALAGLIALLGHVGVALVVVLAVVATYLLVLRAVVKQ